MAGNETLRAHCGACASRMVLRWQINVSRRDGPYWYACEVCGEETTPRPTPTEAAEDVVWAPAKQQRPQRADR